MSDVVVGQVLWLKIRFNNAGDIAKIKHPCLVLAVENDYVEVAHGDSLAGKEYKGAAKTNFVIYNDNDRAIIPQIENILQKMRLFHKNANDAKCANLRK